MCWLISTIISPRNYRVIAEFLSDAFKFLLHSKARAGIFRYREAIQSLIFSHMGQIFLVRHGQASFGSDNYDQLSPLGIEQAKILGTWFARCGQRFDRIVTGGMKRHHQTAEACITALGAHEQLASHSDDGFNEYDHDEIMRRHRPEFADPKEVKRFLATQENAKRLFQQEFEKGMARWMGGQFDHEYKESWQAFRQRCAAALGRLMQAEEASQRIVVFTSGGTISALCQVVLGLPDGQVAQLNWSLVNSAVTKLMFQNGNNEAGQHAPRISLSYLNNYAHLESMPDSKAITYR
jgi:broad specificity phosphatase PhoE